MRIAILSSEAVPFAKTGGLADVSGALTKALHTEGVDSFLIIPLYDQVDRSLLSGIFVDDLEVEWRGKRPRIRVWHSDALNAPTYLIEASHYFERGKIYGEVDDFERFAFFCRNLEPPLFLEPVDAPLTEQVASSPIILVLGVGCRAGMTLL